MGRGGGVRVGGGGQAGCERRIDVFVKIKKKWGGGRGLRVDVIEELKFFFGKFTKKKLEGGGVRVDVIEELKFLGKFTKTNWGGGGG